METYWKVWRSEVNGDFHWVLSMPNSKSHDYTGIADTWEKADTDINLSVEHYIFTRMMPHRTL